MSFEQNDFQVAKEQVKTTQERLTRSLQKLQFLRSKKGTLDQKIKEFSKLQHTKLSSPEIRQAMKALELYTHVSNELLLFGTALEQVKKDRKVSRLDTAFTRMDTSLQKSYQALGSEQNEKSNILGKITSLKEGQKQVEKLRAGKMSEEGVQKIFREYMGDRNILHSLTSGIEQLLARLERITAHPKKLELFAQELQQEGTTIERSTESHAKINAAWRSALYETIGTFGASWTREFGCFRITNAIVRKIAPGKSLQGNPPPVLLSNIRRQESMRTPHIPALIQQMNLRPGAVFWVQSTPGCDAVSMGRNGVRNHWFVFSGYNTAGQPLFVDQGKERTIAGFGWCVNRYVHKIFQA